MAIQTVPPTVALSTSPLTNSMRDKDIKRNHRRRLSGKVRKLPSHLDINEQTHDFSNKDDKIAFIISKLSPDDLEVLARSNYQYLKSPNPSKRKVVAGHVVRRILESKKGNVVSTLTKVKKMIEFRRQAKVDELVTIFNADTHTNTGTAVEKLKKQLATKKLHVQGFDKDGRSTLYFVPRNAVDHELDSAIYSIERAIACSRSLDKTFNCLVDFAKFPLSNIPPLEIGKQFLTTLRLVYAGQIHRIFVVNAPFSFSVLWSVFSPFVGTDTKDKIAIIKDYGKDKEKEFLHLYDRKELPSWAVPGGEKNRSLNVDEYLFELPFDSAFDAIQ